MPDPYQSAIDSIQSTIDALERERARQNRENSATICRLQLAIIDLLDRRDKFQNQTTVLSR